MVIAETTRPGRNEPSTGILGGAAAARMLGAGALGTRLLAAARVAAALHMAQSGAVRTDGAQNVREERR